MHIGLIGLGTMGANLARNAARNGATVSVYNRTTEKMNTFIEQYGHEGRFVGATTLSEFIASIPAPRTIILMVNAGAPVDAVITELIQSGLQTGDLLIDAGNSHFSDTERRESTLKAQGIHWIGMGVSGGEEGALKGPSMMPGGAKESYERVEELFTKMAAKDGKRGACITHVGERGAGHFVKMVHNGIEYGDMQLIAEAYHLLRSMGLSTDALAEVFAGWNRTKELKSYLIEISGAIFAVKDPDGAGALIDVIRDAAKQKGTGKWTTETALDLGVMIPTITAAVDARYLSARSTERGAMQSSFSTLNLKPLNTTIRAVKDALFLSKICSYAQGFSLIAEANRVHAWGISLPDVCRIWRGGCIIRSSLLQTFEDAFRTSPDLPNLLTSPSIRPFFQKKQMAWRRVIARGLNAGIPLPAMTASLSYFDALRTEQLPQNLTQAQRDYFGAHGFEKKADGLVHHHQW